MKPTTGTKSAQTRERLLSAAATELSTRGYSATTLGHIAKRAGVQAPAVYYYFDSREDLVAEVMAAGQSRLREHVVAALDALPTQTLPIDRIEAAVEAHLRITLELSDFASATTRNSGQLPEEMRERQRAEGRRYIAIWRDLLDAARLAGEIRDDIDLGAACMFVIGALNWSPEWWDPSKGSLDEVVRTAQRIVRSGLSTTTNERNPHA